MGVPIGRVQQDGIYLALLFHIRLEVPVHQASSDAACQLLRLQLAWIFTPHLHLTGGGGGVVLWWDGRGGEGRGEVGHGG